MFLSFIDVHIFCNSVSPPSIKLHMVPIHIYICSCLSFKSLCKSLKKLSLFIDQFRKTSVESFHKLIIIKCWYSDLKYKQECSEKLHVMSASHHCQCTTHAMIHAYIYLQQQVIIMIILKFINNHYSIIMVIGDPHMSLPSSSPVYLHYGDRYWGGVTDVMLTTTEMQCCINCNG